MHDGNTSKIEKLKRLFPKSCWMLGFDNFTFGVKDLNKILSHHIKKHQKDEVIITSLISHPKSMGAYNINLMKDFVNSVRDKYGDAVEFTTYRKVYEDFVKRDYDY